MKDLTEFDGYLKYLCICVIGATVTKGSGCVYYGIAAMVAITMLTTPVIFKD